MEELKKQLVDICNQSGLSLEAILFVTKDLWRDVEDTIRAFKEKQQKQEENKDESEEKKE